MQMLVHLIIHATGRPEQMFYACTKDVPRSISVQKEKEKGKM